MYYLVKLNRVLIVLYFFLCVIPISCTLKEDNPAQHQVVYSYTATALEGDNLPFPASVSVENFNDDRVNETTLLGMLPLIIPGFPYATSRMSLSAMEDVPQGKLVWTSLRQTLPLCLADGLKQSSMFTDIY